MKLPFAGISPVFVRLPFVVCVVACSLLLAGCDEPKTQPPKNSPVAQTPNSVPASATPIAPTKPIETAPVVAAKPKDDSPALLEFVAEKYRTTPAYADQAYVVMRYKLNDKPFEVKAPLTVAYERPNKLRLECYDVKLLNDGRSVHGAILGLDGVLELPAPEKLTAESLVVDAAMQESLTLGFGMYPLQLLLSFSEKALDYLLPAGVEAKLLPDLNQAGRMCRRIKVSSEAGDLVIWIDAQRYLILRVDYPIETLRKELEKSGKVTELEQYADFVDATFEPKFPPAAFVFEVPKEALLVKRIVPAPLPLRPTALLGKTSPKFTFKDAEGVDVTPDLLNDKVVFFAFWSPESPQSLEALAALQRVADKYRDDKNFQAYAVALVAAGVDNGFLQSRLKAAKITLPLLRDPNGDAGNAFGVQAVPSVLILGKDGLVQHHRPRLEGNLVPELQSICDELLAGRATHEATLRDYEQRLAEYRRFQQTPPETARAVAPVAQLEPATIAAADQPKTFKTRVAWSVSNEEIKQAGNIVAVPAQGDRPARIFALDGWEAVCEFDAAGKLIARHELKLPEQTAVSTLRIAYDKEGKQFALLLHPYDARGQFYLYDADWKRVLEYPTPEDRGEDKISDAELVDLDGDGTLEIAVAYSGPTGVQVVRTNGDRVWRNRTDFRRAFHMAAGEPGAGGKRPLLSPNEIGVVIALDAEGEATAKWQIPGQQVVGVFGAESEPGKVSIAGVVPSVDGTMSVVGFTNEGKASWLYPLPRGYHAFPIDFVASAKLSANKPSNWLLAGADGSIHLLGMDGKLVDRFNSGTTLRGLAGLHDGTQALIVYASDKGLQAVALEPLEVAEPAK